MSKFALIIEDDIDLSTIFAEALKNATYDTEVIHDGNTALKRLATTTPDVVVLDLHLPGVDGTNILREIRADKRLSETRVLVATADARLAACADGRIAIPELDALALHDDWQSVGCGIRVGHLERS